MKLKYLVLPKFMKNEALILLAHGSRDSSWSIPFKKIEVELKEKWSFGPVRLAFFELEKPLIEDVVEELRTYGQKKFHIEPLLLANGFHIKNDLPKRIKKLEGKYKDIFLSSGNALIDKSNIRNSICQSIINERFTRYKNINL